MIPRGDCPTANPISTFVTGMVIAVIESSKLQEHKAESGNIAASVKNEQSQVKEERSRNVQNKSNGKDYGSRDKGKRDNSQKNGQRPQNGQNKNAGNENRDGRSNRDNRDNNRSYKENRNDFKGQNKKQGQDNRYSANDGHKNNRDNRGNRENRDGDFRKNNQDSVSNRRVGVNANRATPSAPVRPQQPSKARQAAKSNNEHFSKDAVEERYQDWNNQNDNEKTRLEQVARSKRNENGNFQNRAGKNNKNNKALHCSAKFFRNNCRCIYIQFLIDRCHHTHGHQLHNHICRFFTQLTSQILYSDAILQHYMMFHFGKFSWRLFPHIFIVLAFCFVILVIFSRSVLEISIFIAM
mgnify:CR=1 FL=1